MVAKTKYTKNCSTCGSLQTYGRKDHYKSAVKGDWKCKLCSAKTSNKGKGKYYEIPITWFSVKQRAGTSRGYQWDLTIEDVWAMYEEQDRICELSGVAIGWSEKGLTATASIDRIDSTEGYIKGNVQLVHKDVNFMKQQFDQDYFIELCKCISKNNQSK
jgi:hypothetical protein